jgi:hypothetical protein
VHLHTDEPELATAVFGDAGEVSHLDVADMRLQVAERDERLASAASDPSENAAISRNGTASSKQTRCGALAVISGVGLQQMFEELGVHTLDGGPTLNPSTYELLAAIHEVQAEEVVVLPGSANVIMAAERAAELSDKRVVVVAATSQQAGLTAALALAFDRDVQENARALNDALARLRTGAVAPAARDDAQGRFGRGEAVGFVEEQVVAWGEPGETLRAVLSALANGSNGSAQAELISVLAGAQAPLDLAAVERLLDGESTAELELRDGGQAAYWWLLAAE